MLGHDLVRRIRAVAGIELTGLARADLDVTDPAAVGVAVAGHDLVLNAAAWTDVDAAETHEVTATAVNGHAVATLARACAAGGARLVTVSTDYVFAGDATTPYPEDAPTAPINAYGRGKLVAEQAVRSLLPESGYVVRTAWLYGVHGRNFVTTILRLAGQLDTVDVVDDQVGQPTGSDALAVRLVELGQRALAGDAPAGVYHGTAAGATSWYGLARAVFAAAGLDPGRVRPTTSASFERRRRAERPALPRPARRPAYSVLGHDGWRRAGLPAMADWHTALAEAMPDLLGAASDTDAAARP
jgi:dTDP-4-dehydrorhamnose reductase